MLARLKRKLKRARHDEHHEHELNCEALCCAKNGQSACILHLSGSADEAARLRDLGLCEGARVTVLRDGDPLVVRAGDARFGIGRAAAMNVLCTLEER